MQKDRGEAAPEAQVWRARSVRVPRAPRQERREREEHPDESIRGLDDESHGPVAWDVARVSRSEHYCNVKFTVTVINTGVGTPLSVVGVYFHCITASSAASSSNATLRKTLACAT